MLQNIRAFKPQFVSPQQQFCKIHHATTLAGQFIGAVNLEHGLAELVTGRYVDVRCAQTFIFLRIDIPLSLFWWPARFVQRQLPAHTLDQTQLVIAVQDLEILRQAGLFPVRLQQAMSQAVKSPDPHAVGGNLQHLLNTRAHFPGGLVSKGHCQHRPGREVHGAYQPGNTVHQHPGLAATGTGQHQQVLVFRSHSFSLRIVEGG